MPKITQAFGQTCLLTPGLPALSDYHLPHSSFSLSSALSDLACPQSRKEERKERSSRQCLPSSERPSVRELGWGMGPEISVLISPPIPRTLGMDQPCPVWAANLFTCLIMSFCDTPGPATHCSDPSILISRFQKLYQVTTWPWGSDFLSVGLSELSAKRGICQGLRAGLFSKVGKGRSADVHGRQTCGEEPSGIRMQQDHLQKTAQERWLRKRAHVSPMEKIPDKHCLTPLGLPSVSSPLAAGLGYKCYTA